MRKASFTLIELLVVVAVIAILASLLFPSLGAARQKAKALQCLSNQRQCGMATWMYANDNKGCGIGYDGLWPTAHSMQRYWPDLFMMNGYLPEKAIQRSGTGLSILPFPNVFSCPAFYPPPCSYSNYGLTVKVGQSCSGWSYGIRGTYGPYPSGFYYQGEKYVAGAIPLMHTMKTDAPFMGDSLTFLGSSLSGAPVQGVKLNFDGASGSFNFNGELYMGHRVTCSVWFPDGHSASMTSRQLSAIKQPGWAGASSSSPMLAYPFIR